MLAVFFKASPGNENKLLKELEIEEKWAEKGVSRYGNNNVFGAGTTVIKGLK